MPKPIKVGRKERMSFGTIEEVWPMPNLIDIQTKSYEQFLKEGLKEVFDDISPIRDYSDNLSLEFVDYSLSDPPKYGIEECRERKVTYAAPLNVKVRLVIRDTGEVKEQDIYMGDFPLMTEQGTFIINGSDRVIVTQLVRSPGAYYSVETDKSNQKLYSAQVIPTRGAWIEYETDSYGVLNVRVDRNRKQPVTILLRALGLETNEQIIDTLGTDERLLATLEKDPTANQVEALKEVYKKLRPGDPPTYDSAKALVNGLLFDAKRYDVAHVGRFKYNKKLGVSERLVNVYAEEDVIDPNTGEVLVERGGLITREMGRVIEQAGVGSVLVHSQDDETPTKIVGNQFVDIGPYLEGRNVDLSDFNVPADKVYYPVLKEILDMDLGDDELKDMLMSRRDELSPKHIIVPDIIAATSYLINLNHGVGSVDDIDHLGNRRLRTVGELLQNQFRIGLARMERSVRERMMQVQDNDATPQSLVNIRPVTAAVREFFGSSPLSQFIDQNNPLSELTHKRRLSALGPGGLSRERAGFEVRDIHYSHYGRLCPIETPEGPNIGLIGSLTTYGVINRYGFIETPYRIVDKEKGIVTKNVRYFAADEEELLIVAQANEPLDEEGHFVNEKVAARGVGGEIAMFPKDQVDLMDVSPKQVVSVASAMIPFLENDDANRALMGSNMQRQAVPLLVTEAPFVGTGIEYKAARDSGVVILAKHSGTVDFVDAENIIIVRDDGEGVDEYTLLKFRKSNQETCINQRPIVSHGEHIEEGEVIADGPSTDLGEISLGKNLLIGFMTWEGYNYEDAVILNEKLVMDDVLTSIHIVEYECKARETKLGPEEITSDIPGVSDSERRNLDENGIVRIGAEVNQRDILVGKVSPKGQSGHDECSEHLLRSVFGEKARDVKNTSRKMPNGEHGIVIDVQVYTRENSDELDPDVTKLVRVYVASKRKMQVGDKMAGRHGNKGVVSRILPEEDMPFLDDGTPLQMMLNPLGVPSRMNVGQVLEVHLGLVAKKKGWYVATPVFAGAKEENIRALLRECGYPESGKLRLRDGRTGEYFEKPITVGYMYMLKLHHLVDDKIHARSTATYSLITQQPLGGKAQRGGQRFGEMEVWALEAYGAAYTLQEILTVKSDDIVGRNNLYAAIVKGENIPTPGIPESFKVLIKELQSLALDVRVLNGQGEEIELKEVMGSGNYHYSLKPDAILERSPREPEMIELDEPKDAEAAAAAGSDEPDAEGSDFTGDVDEFDDGLADAGEASGPDADLEDSDLYDAEDLPDPEDAAEEPDTEE